MAGAVGAFSPVGEARDTPLTPVKLAGSLLTIVLPIVVWFSPLNLEPVARHALAVASFMIIAWIFETLPHALTGMIGCYLFWVLKVVPFEVAFTGFADQTPWFLFGASMFGMMATKSGLARRLAYLIMRRLGGGYSRVLLGLIFSSFLLTFLVPSGIACVVIMAAVAVGLMQLFGLGRGSNVGRGIFLTLTYTAGYFDKMVVAGSSSILGRGLIEKSTHLHIYWSIWLLAFLPCAIVGIFGTWRLILWFYPPEPEAQNGAGEYLNQELVKMGAWSALEKKALFLMLLAIALWMTDLIHHISPAVIGIGVGLFAAVPRWGVLNQEDMKKLNYLPVFFVATAISMGEVLVHTGALRVLTAVLFDWMRPVISGGAALLILVPYWTAFVYHLFLGSEISMLATSVPGLMSFAQANALPALPLGLIWSFSAGGKVFVYQSGVLVTGYSYGYFDSWDIFRLGICLTIIEAVVLLLIVPFYWPVLGIH